MAPKAEGKLNAFLGWEIRAVSLNEKNNGDTRFSRGGTDSRYSRVRALTLRLIGKILQTGLNPEKTNKKMRLLKKVHGISWIFRNYWTSYSNL